MTSKRSLFITIALMLFLGVFPKVGSSANFEFDTTSLKGIKTIEHTLSINIEDLKKSSTLENSIRTQVELKLRLAGITVIDSSKDTNTIPDAVLGISVQGVRTDKVPYSYYAAAYNVHLSQMVTIYRDKTIRTFGDTWKVGGIMTNYKENEIESALGKKIDAILDRFINDYLKVNPR